MSELIEQSKRRLGQTTNATLTLLYWQIGRRFNSEVLSNKRADYGKQVVSELSVELVEQSGNGFSEKYLQNDAVYEGFSR
ncbi:DUF1016 N-terminal domain-containing protein [Arachidicoccus rhizosphaerae]|uniref:DUF1016 N-terminal domain-containing protein n=1 Tax=Arachidicoccus rhizosphaerae TaxID=551991 RepID=UPI000B84C091